MKNLKIAVSILMIALSVSRISAIKKTTTKKTSTKTTTTKKATTGNKNTTKLIVPSEPALGMANPDSKFCEDKGGKSITVKDKDGNETGKCQLKNGTIIDEWDYYRENN